MIEQNDLQAVVIDLLSRDPNDECQTVLLRIPLDRSYDEFGELEVGAFFVSDDFALAENQILDQAHHLFELDRYGFDMTRQELIPREQAGETGSAIPVCCSEQPLTYGYWHDDYYRRGLTLPAPYCFERFTYQRARPEGIYISIGGEDVGSWSVWHDAWTPMYAPNSDTRCGSITRIKRDKLATAATRLKQKVGWFVRLSRMQKPAGGFEREPKDVTAFVRV